MGGNVGSKRQMLTIRASCFITERSGWCVLCWCWLLKELYESVRSRSSLSSSLASWIVWLIRKKAARNEMIAVVLELVFIMIVIEKGKRTCERVND